MSEQGSYEWRGIKPDGTGAGGAMTITRPELAAIVEDRFAHGWRSLAVLRDGALVAAIGRNPDDERTWWAES